jgi:hypothetical protein
MPATMSISTMGAICFWPAGRQFTADGSEQIKYPVGANNDGILIPWFPDKPILRV